MEDVDSEDEDEDDDTAAAEEGEEAEMSREEGEAGGGKCEGSGSATESAPAAAVNGADITRGAEGEREETGRRAEWMDGRECRTGSAGWSGVVGQRVNQSVSEVGDSE